MMVKGDYSSDVTMKLSVWQKDMNAIAEFAKANGCPTPLFSATAPLYIAATATNPTEDTGAVCAVIEKLANYRRRKLRRDLGSGDSKGAVGSGLVGSLLSACSGAERDRRCLTSPCSRPPSDPPRRRTC